MAGGAYLLREREAYDQETAARQEAVLKKLGEEIRPAGGGAEKARGGNPGVYGGAGGD